MSDLFKTPTQEGTAQQLADSIPQGRAWGAKNIDESNTRKLINSLGVAYSRVQQQIELLSNEFDILQSLELLPDWEESVSLPSECLGESETIQQRREAVIQRLRKEPTVTLSQMQAFLDSLFPGFGLVLIPGYEFYSFEYGFEVPFLGAIDEKFVLVVTVPTPPVGTEYEYEFELEFSGGPATQQIECLLRKIVPANVIIIIETVG